MLLIIFYKSYNFLNFTYFFYLQCQSVYLIHHQSDFALDGQSAQGERTTERSAEEVQRSSLVSPQLFIKPNWGNCFFCSLEDSNS